MAASSNRLGADDDAVELGKSLAAQGSCQLRQPVSTATYPTASAPRGTMRQGAKLVCAKRVRCPFSRHKDSAWQLRLGSHSVAQSLQSCNILKLET